MNFTRGKIGGKVRLVCRFMVIPDGKSPACPQKQPFLRRLKIQGSSSKTALFEDGLTNKPQLILNNRPKRGRKHEKTFRGRWLKGKLGKFQRLEIKSFLR